jgi:hypothetical protein
MSWAGPLRKEDYIDLSKELPDVQLVPVDATTDQYIAVD